MTHLTSLFLCVDAGYLPSRSYHDDDIRSPSRLVASPPTSRRPKSSMPKRSSTTRQLAEAYVPTWERHAAQKAVNSTTALALAAPPPPKGRRAHGASASAGAGGSDRRRSRSPPVGHGMLYFGTPLSPPQQAPAHTTAAAAAAQRASNSAPSSAAGAAGCGGVGQQHASGRDASGHLVSGVSAVSVMSGAYASLTYGGSTQYNYAGT